MSEMQPRRARRADAERHAEAVVSAAVEVLGRDPRAGLDEVARAAGVSRQTVYAHVGSREALLTVVVGRITTEVLDALDAAEREAADPTGALLALLEASWELLDRYPLLLDSTTVAAVGAAGSPGAGDDRAHEPIRSRFRRVLSRGRRRGEFDQELPVAWQVAALLAIGHAAGAEVAAGRMTAPAAAAAVRSTVLRIVRPLG